MPRPGPRPYECVRRAWHSDTHKPIRGSMIQQILRIVTDAHSSTTRKNKEWQMKLPRVVFKAEEIMYSKANSEAEYTDPDTLWERLNDAVDTIIRRDGSTETGQCLQPCIEAALVLGCVPVRTSRSQRYSNPRSYLNPRDQEPAQAVAMTGDRTNHHRVHLQSATPSGNHVTVSRSIMPNQASTSPLNNQIVTNPTHIATLNDPRLQRSFPQQMPSTAIESNTPLNFGSVYPLCYGNYFQTNESNYGFRLPQNQNPSNIIIGKPVGWPVGEPSCFPSTKNLLPDESKAITMDKLRQEKPGETPEIVGEKACDLSLRLGVSDPCTSTTKGFARVTEDDDLNSCPEKSKLFEPKTKSREFCFFPSHDSSDPPESCNFRLEQEGVFQDKNAVLREHDRFGDRSRWPGL